MSTTRTDVSIGFALGLVSGLIYITITYTQARRKYRRVFSF